MVFFCPKRGFPSFSLIPFSSPYLIDGSLDSQMTQNDHFWTENGPFWLPKVVNFPLRFWPKVSHSEVAILGHFGPFLALFWPFLDPFLNQSTPEIPTIWVKSGPKVGPKMTPKRGHLWVPKHPNRPNYPILGHLPCTHLGSF